MLGVILFVVSLLCQAVTSKIEEPLEDDDDFFVDVELEEEVEAGVFIACINFPAGVLRSAEIVLLPAALLQWAADKMESICPLNAVLISVVPNLPSRSVSSLENSFDDNSETSLFVR